MASPLLILSIGFFTVISTEHKKEIAENRFPDNVKHPFEDSRHVLDLHQHFHAEDLHQHFHAEGKSDPESKYEEYVMAHAIWTQEELDSVSITHKKPKRVAEWMAYGATMLLRAAWDTTTGYALSRMPGIGPMFPFSYKKVALRLVFLETVAGVPGMMFGMVRHLNSLRRLERDRGWIKTLLAEAENERIHLLVAMSIHRPGRFVRAGVLVVQGIFCPVLFTAYMISPRFCHSFVGYVEEQAVVTYTHILEAIDAGKYPEFEVPASDLAIKYWRLPEGSTWRLVFDAMRADEANHRFVNHTLSDLSGDPKAVNPFRLKVNAK